MAETAQTADQFGRAQHIADAQAGHSIGLRQRMELQDIAGAQDGFDCRQRRSSIVLIRLVEHHQPALCCQPEHLLGRQDAPSRVVWIAEPAERLLRPVLPGWFQAVEPAGIGIFAERRLVADIVLQALSPRHLSNEVDGFRSAAGHQQAIPSHPFAAGDKGLQRLGLRLGVGSNAVQPRSQEEFQPVQVGMTVDIATEVMSDALVAKGIVSVSSEHFSIV